MNAHEFLTQPETFTGGSRNFPPYPFPKLNTILEKERHNVPIYGIYCWMIDYPTYRDAIREIGFTNIRIAGPISDEVFAMILEDGLDILCTLGKSRGKFESDEAFVLGNVQEYLDFLRRYGPNGSYFKEHPEHPYRPVMNLELFNEPNFGYMIPDKDPIEKKVDLYTQLQLAAYPAIKAEFPDVKVLAFGAGGASAADMGFIHRCFAKDPRIQETMDVLTTHPYVDPRPPFCYLDWLPDHCIASAHKNLRGLLDSHNRKDVPIWYTELGWFIPPSLGGHFDSCQNGNTLLEQAAYNVQMYMLGLRLGVERITTMYIMDTDYCNPGFVNRDGSLRPSGYAVKVMTDVLPDPKLVGAIYDGNDYNTYAYRLESKVGGEEVIMAFTAKAPQSIVIPWEDATARLTDMLGNEKVVEAKDGTITVDAGIYPIYIRHA